MIPRIKFRIPFFVLIFLVLAAAEAATRVFEFYATRDQSAVVLVWSTEEETNLARFEIERSSDGSRWIQVGKTPAAGDSWQKRTYSYRDNSIFKTGVNTLYYRLILVDRSGNSQVFETIASAEGQSGIRHTWGSIKAMFR
jgi:hypothetical protein